jgi:hypothetical protein
MLALDYTALFFFFCILYVCYVFYVRSFSRDIAYTRVCRWSESSYGKAISNTESQTGQMVPTQLKCEAQRQPSNKVSVFWSAQPHFQTKSGLNLPGQKRHRSRLSMSSLAYACGLINEERYVAHARLVYIHGDVAHIFFSKLVYFCHICCICNISNFTL